MDSGLYRSRVDRVHDSYINALLLKGYGQLKAGRFDEAFREFNAATINSFPFFILQPGSPAIRSGKRIANNGGIDYWGNNLLADRSPNIGAYGK